METVHFGRKCAVPQIAPWTKQQDGATAIKSVMGRVQTIAHRLIEAVEDDGQPPPKAAAALREGARLAA